MTAFLLDERAGDSLVLFERVSLRLPMATANDGCRNGFSRPRRCCRWSRCLATARASCRSAVSCHCDMAPRMCSLPLLGVSATGRLVLVECKLWRNPEARREVVAQLFEYATLLSEWTYSDLEARLKKARRLTGENPIFAAVRTAHPELEEAAFVDAVNQSLARGDFLLAIAGDGIRSDLQTMRRLLGAQGGLLSSHSSRFAPIGIALAIPCWFLPSRCRRKS